MSEINTGGPAFPVPEFPMTGGQYFRRADLQGMTLRDYFAAKAMQAALSGVEHEDSRGELHSMSTDWYDCHAAHAYAMADAMLKARQGGQA